MRTVLRDPLLLFLALGLLLFGLYTWLRPPDQAKEVISISPETIEAIVQQDELIRGRKCTPEERRNLVESHIDDEVLLREARRQGLDKTDSRVRKRLLGVMRYSLIGNVPEPTRQQLEAYYNEKRETYKTQPAVSFEHVYFSWDSKQLPEDPDSFRNLVAETEDPITLGESLFPSNRTRRASRIDLLGTFGPAFADAIKDLEAGDRWHGPIESNRGTHYVRILERHEPVQPSFDEMESYLRQDWLLNRNREDQQNKIDEMRKRYRIVISQGGEQ